MNRAARWIVAIAAVGVLLLVLGVVADRVARPEADPAPVALDEGRRTVPLELGVTVFSMWRDWEYLDELLDRARDSGSGWVRVDMGWCTWEEAGPGTESEWYSGRLDATVAGAEQRGLRLLVSVGCAPTWAGGRSFDDHPDDPAEFERFTRMLAERYRGRIAAW